MLGIKKSSQSGGFLLFRFLVQGFEAPSADSFPYPFDFFELKINAELPKGLDIGMTDGVSRLGTAAADVADSRHSTFSG